MFNPFKALETAKRNCYGGFLFLKKDYASLLPDNFVAEFSKAIFGTALNYARCLLKSRTEKQFSGSDFFLPFANIDYLFKARPFGRFYSVSFLPAVCVYLFIFNGLGVVSFASFNIYANSCVFLKHSVTFFRVCILRFYTEGSTFLLLLNCLPRKILEKCAFICWKV